jgi:hypothetical protein
MSTVAGRFIEGWLEKGGADLENSSPVTQCGFGQIRVKCGRLVGGQRWCRYSLVTVSCRQAGSGFASNPHQTGMGDVVSSTPFTFALN